MVIHGIMCVMEKQYGFEASGQMLEGEEGTYSAAAAGAGSCPLACAEPCTAGAVLTRGSLWGSCQPDGSADLSWGQGQDGEQHIKTQEGPIIKPYHQTWPNNGRLSPCLSPRPAAHTSSFGEAQKPDVDLLQSL